MRLLYITAFCDPNHPYTPHVFAWVREMAQYCEHIDLIALQAAGQPADNVSVYSLGIDMGKTRVERWGRFVALLSRLAPQCDAILSQFSASFALGAWPFAWLLRKPNVLWYAHGAVPFQLKLAERVVDKIVTSSTGGCRLESAKIVVVGQGIDTNLFAPISAPRFQKRPFTAVSVGRLSPIKRFEDLIAATESLVHRYHIGPLRVRIVGAPPNHAGELYALYADTLRQQAETAGLTHVIEFTGTVSYADMPACYQNADVMVNLGETGSMDKVVLEAMSCGLVVLSANEAYAELLSACHPWLVLEKRNVPLLAERLHWLMQMPAADRIAMGRPLREVVVAEHGLNCLGRRLVSEIEELACPEQSLS